MITIHPITIAVLDVLLPLLSQSYGAPVTLADEKAYFETVQPIGWYYAKGEEELMGFIRYFPVGTASLVQLELFATSTAIEQQLLDYFLGKWLLVDTKLSVRLCCRLSKKGLITTAQDLGFQQVATYQIWYLDELSQQVVSNAVRWAEIKDSAVIQVLAEKTFGAFDSNRLSQQLKSKTFTVLEQGNRVLGYCLCNTQITRRTIIQLAIDPNCRRKGYGLLLLLGSLNLYRQQLPKLTFSLQVNANNDPAIKLYQRAGFYPVHIGNWLVYKSPS